MDSATFTPQTTHEVLEQACRVAGLNPDSAELARMGENAMYRLASTPVMARIGRSVAASRKEARIASWLASHQFPAARSAAVDAEQPVVVDDLAVTFWEVIEESDEPVTSADLGVVLRDMHALPEPSDLSLPFFEPTPKVEKRLADIGEFLPEDDRQFLSERREELEQKFAALNFTLGFGPVHGDYHRGNLMRDRSGTVKLIDFEDFCWGPREWDACVEAVRYRAMGWVNDEDYAAYVRAYGFDPLDLPGFPVLRAIRELNMTTWLAQQLGQSTQVDAEVHKRIADLRDGEAPRSWRVF
jgi:Ser/Thr protein kinase RdoA (MazF antagonist)